MATQQVSADSAAVTVPAVPPIPERKHRLSTTSQRRKSLPPLNSQPSKRSPQSANDVHVQPASPEVISSLISSLSSISTPVQEHFASGPSLAPSRSTPSTPAAFQNTFPDFDIITQHGTADSQTPKASVFGAPNGTYSSIDAAASQEYLSARTMPRPSGAPDSPSFRSKSSSRDIDEVSSIGSVSIEPGAVMKDTASRSSVGSDSRHSRRSMKGLMFMGSKERLKDKENERKKSVNNVEGLGLAGIGDSNGLSIPSDQFVAGNTISEEPIVTDRLPFAPSPSATATSFKSASPGSGGQSPNLTHARLIPTRESSLRNAASPSRKKRHSQQSSRRSSRHEASSGIREESTDKEPEGGTKDDGVLIASRSTERKDTARPKKAKHYPPVLVTSEPPMKLQSPLASPAIVSQPTSRSSPQISPPSEPVGSPKPPPPPVTRVEIKPVESNDESAPSPAIVQRKPREPMDARVTSLAGRSKLVKSPTGRSPSLDILPGSEPSTPHRTSSRLKRVSLPTSPTSDKHRRSISNNLPPGRNSESNMPRPPTLVIEERPSSADSIDNQVEAYMCSPRLSQKIRHPQSGRTISFSEVGDAEGFAVFCCVGMGLTRYITAFYDELALTLKLRLITPDRPGVGDSDSYSDGTTSPLSWPDDVYAICQALKITKFSILAHSAGAIYALATALRMPQHIRGRIHLLAPWIPPSQLSKIGSSQGPAPTGTVPTSQRILRALPTPFLKAANSSFMSATSSSITSSLPKSPRRNNKSKRTGATTRNDTPTTKRDSLIFNGPGSDEENISPLQRAANDADDPNSESAVLAAAASSLAAKERRSNYDERLTHAIWDAATTKANPAVDLLVCLERRQTIGFRYVDITRAVVIHHGSKDSRVPVENVRWLGTTMRRCEVRVLDGEGHGLMASAAVMGGILMEVAKEWEDWMRVVNGERGSSRVSLATPSTRVTPRHSPLLH